MYKAARRREYERLRIMDEEVRKVEEDKDFHEKKERLKEEDDAKTRRNREKREKMRLRKKAKLDKKNGGGGKAVATQASNGATGSGVKARVAQNKDGDEDTADAGKMDVDPNMSNTEATKTDTPGLIIRDDD